MQVFPPFSFSFFFCSGGFQYNDGSVVIMLSESTRISVFNKLVEFFFFLEKVKPGRYVWSQLCKYYHTIYIVLFMTV